MAAVMMMMMMMMMACLAWLGEIDALVRDAAAATARAYRRPMVAGDFASAAGLAGLRAAVFALRGAAEERD
jgi:hypothetical protein